MVDADQLSCENGNRLAGCARLVGIKKEQHEVGALGEAPDALPEVVAAELVAAGGVDHPRAVDQRQLPEVFGRVSLELELGEELRAEVGQVLIIQLGVRHQRLPIECFLFLPVSDQREPVIRRGHAGFLNIGPGDVVDERRFARGMVPEEQNPWRPRHVLVADWQIETVAAGQQRQRFGVDRPDVAFEF